MRKTGQPTINDVARIAGVSKKTVSRVINKSPLLRGDTRSRVETVISNIGYIPNPQARALALRRNYLIGLVHDNPNAQIVMNVQHGMLEALQGTEFELVVRPVDRLSPGMLRDLRHFLEKQRLFGVLLMPPISEDDAITRLCEEIGCRYVRMGSSMFDAPPRMVASNDREGVREAVSYLIDQGHRQIGFVGGPDGYRSADERRAGFEDAMNAAGIPMQQDMIAVGDYQFGSGLAAAERLLALSTAPSAIFAANDAMAAGALHAARRRGLDIPSDLSLIGFDDMPIASHIWPPLTTVRWPIVAMGRSAALKLIATQPEANDTGEASMFLTRLVVRGSVARLSR